MPKEVVGDNEFAVVVGWGKGTETVQISTISKDDPEDAWYVSLNRYQINQVIKNLRAARDQSFGRDE